MLGNIDRPMATLLRITTGYWATGSPRPKLVVGNPTATRAALRGMAVRYCALGPGSWLCPLPREDQTRACLAAEGSLSAERTLATMIGINRWAK
jgi:hypothetical protein